MNTILSMMNFDAASLMAFFSQYAYEPMYVYGFICAFMFASSVGLPIPEELTLISAGLVAYMANHPESYPPPYPGAEGVDIITLCIVCFLAVFLSDFFIYLMGKFFGAKIVKMKFFQKQIAGQGFKKINSWFEKYGGMACGIFRFTPGLRFPGHLSCGFLGIPVWKFLLIDGIAAGFSVPTQVYLVATYGEIILTKLTQFKVYVLYTAGVLLVLWLIKKVYEKWTQKHLT